MSARCGRGAHWKLDHLSSGLQARPHDFAWKTGELEPQVIYDLSQTVELVNVVRLCIVGEGDHAKPLNRS